MRAVIQRVNRASVTIGNVLKSEIDSGLLVLAGIDEDDDNDDVEWLANKISSATYFQRQQRGNESFRP